MDSLAGGVGCAGGMCHSRASGDSWRAITCFHQVAPGLYRGGQPTPTGSEFLKWRDIKTVIKLRGENDEHPLVEQLGMKYVHLLIRLGDRIPDSVIQAFLAVALNPRNQPVFVHCQRGADRTGAMIGFYRMRSKAGTAAQRTGRREPSGCASF